MRWCLKACRVQAGLTQLEASKVLKISEKTLINYETGKSAPNMDVAQRLSELYLIPMGEMDFSCSGNSVLQRKVIN